MNSNNKLFYSKIYLRNKFGLEREKNEEEFSVFTEHFGIVADLLNCDAQIAEDAIEGRTREQLLKLGFSVGQIQEYIEFKSCDDKNEQYRWVIKKDIVINNKNIQSVYDLTKILDIRHKRNAS